MVDLPPQVMEITKGVGPELSEYRDALLLAGFVFSIFMFTGGATKRGSNKGAGGQAGSKRAQVVYDDVEEEEVIEGDDALLTNTPAKPNQNSVTPHRGDAGAAETPVQRAKRE